MDSVGKLALDRGPEIDKPLSRQISIVRGDTELTKEATDKFDVGIIGGGPAGYVAAIRAAQLGAKTAVVEARELGGTCLNRGCIPSKALLRCVEVIELARSAKRMGLKFAEPEIDFDGVRRHAARAIKTLVSGVEALMESNSIAVFRGHGNLIDPVHIEVTGSDETISFEAGKIILCTGSVPFIPPIPGADGEGIIDSDQAVALPGPPESLVVIGGGAVGSELAQVYAGLGTKGTLVEMLDRLVPTEDPDAGALLESTMKKQGVRVLTRSKALEIADVDGGKRLELDCDGEGEIVEAEMVLMATSRRAYTDGLGLEEVGVSTERGRIVVSEHLQTNIENVYAAGDVRRGVGLAHLASHEGIVAVENALGVGEDGAINYDAVPAVIYTHPEIGSVGVQEHEIAERGVECSVGSFPYSANARAAAYGERQGFVKLIAEARSGQIIGGTVVGRSARELLAEITLALRMGLTFDDVAATIHRHPTISEAIGEAALAGLGRAIHLP